MSIPSSMLSAFFACSVLASAALPSSAQDKKESPPDQVLFNFADPAILREWKAAKLPELATAQPAPQIEIADKHLKITFSGGDWPTVGTTKIPVVGDWKPFQTLKVDLTVDRPSIAYFRVNQSKSDDNGQPYCWQKTLNLPVGRTAAILMIRNGLGNLDPARGDVVSFNIGMFRPEKGQTLLVGNIQLGSDWPAPKTLGWYSPYNHDGYSAAVAREYQRTGAVPTFKVLGTHLEVADLKDLALRLKDQWNKPAPKLIEQVEADFRAEFAKLQKEHPHAVLSILRDGERGWDPAQPDKVYAGWKTVYITSHGPDGPNRGRENSAKLSDTVEAFMRHRSVLMEVDLTTIPKEAKILSAKLVVTRSSDGREPPAKPNMWVAEPCNRAWDENSATCYSYARGKLWKAVNGLYYGDDPDYWPLFIAHGPAGGGAVSVLDFTEAIKFWRDGQHANHGFFLHGDSVDYMKMYTKLSKEVKQRPAVMVIYDPK